MLAVADRDNLTRQIRDAVDIVDLVSSYVSLRRAGASFKGLCPFHEEKTPSFIVTPSRQMFKCFGCGAGGDVFTFLQLRERVDFPEARRMLGERAGIALEEETVTGGGGPGKRDLARANAWAQKLFRRHYRSPDGAQARAYVAGRGISEEMAEAFGLGLSVDSFDSLLRHAQQAGVDPRLLAAAGLIKERQGGGYYDTFRHRLMFPIHDTTDRIIGFGGRTLGDDPAKYLNTPATLLFDKSAHLFGLDRARHRLQEAGRAVVVEGYTDCMMAHQFGFTETVATLGTAMTEAHARLLKRYTDRVVLVFDSDEAGQRAADRALAVTLTVGLDVTLARVDEGKDPCDYLLSAGKTGFESVLNQGLGALEFKWQQVARAYEASPTGLGRRRAIDAYLQQLAEWLKHGAVDHIQTGLLLNQLSRILSLPPEDLHRQLQGVLRRSGGSLPSGPGPQADTAGRGPTGTTVNAAQEAMRQIVEVLLNEPSLYPSVAGSFDASAIADPSLAAVARELIPLLESAEDEPFSLGDLLARLASPEYGRLITDLAARGERRGDYQVVIEGAVACLASYRRAREAATHAEALRSTRDAAAADPAEEDERLLALAVSLKSPHFSTIRARKRFLDG